MLWVVVEVAGGVAGVAAAADSMGLEDLDGLEETEGGPLLLFDKLIMFDFREKKLGPVNLDQVKPSPL